MEPIPQPPPAVLQWPNPPQAQALAVSERNKLLRREFPDLLWPYRKVLFEDSSRQAYIAQLRRRVREAAASLGISDRVSGCG